MVQGTVGRSCFKGNGIKRTLAFGPEFFNILCHNLKSMEFDSILREAEGRSRKGGKENTGLKTRYSAKELLER